MDVIFGHIKKILLFFAFAVLFSMANKAQDFARWGPHFGINASNLTGIDKPSYPQLGYGGNAGIYMELKARSYASACFEINYTQKKSSFSEPIKNIDQSLIEIKEAVDYVEIPFQLRFFLGDETLKLYINSGGYVSGAVRKYRTGDARISGNSIPIDYFYNYPVRFFDYGFSSHAGFQIGAVFVEARYYLSLCNLYEGRNYREMRLQTFNLSFGYEINHPYVFQKSIRHQTLKQKIKTGFRRLIRK